MNRISLIIVSMMVGLISSAQLKTPVIRGFGYVRESLPGTIPRVIGEDGKEVNKPVKALRSYQFFIEHRKGNTIKPTKIWINGIPYKVKTELITKTPYVFERTGLGDVIEKDTLVKKSSYSVIKIIPDGEINPAPMVKDTDKENKMILDYSWKNKKYSMVIKDIRKLSPLVFQ